MTQGTLRLKASRTTLTTLELLAHDLEGFSAQLAEQARQAPDLFRFMPVILDVSGVESKLAPDDLPPLIQAVETAGLRLAALATQAPGLEHAAQSLGLGILNPATKTAASPSETPQPATQTQPAALRVQTSKVITQPVRSGQQIHAEHGDLIVLAPVSAGAEILARGHIHVYGPLRGRALAGVYGDPDARIFCQHLEAELVSIAGQYKISEDLQATHWKQAAQIRLDDQRLVVEAL